MPWLSIIPYALTFLGTAGLALWLHSADVDKIDLRHRDALEAQQRTDVEQCNNDINTAKEAAYEYQTKYDAAMGDLARYKRLSKPTSCTKITSSQAGKPDGKAKSGEPVNERSVPTWSLLDLFAEGEHYRLQTIGLQKFIDDVWASRIQ